MTAQQIKQEQRISNRVYQARCLLSDAMVDLQVLGLHGIAAEIEKAYQQTVIADDWLTTDFNETSA